MLKQAVDWAQMVVTVVEALLLVRVIALKLHRTYAFITLYCAVNVFFDGAAWYLGLQSQESERIFIYSLFFFTVLYPLVVWDVFEESKAQVGKLRRLQIVRLVSGMFLTGICALLLGLNLDTTDAKGKSTLAAFLGIFLLTGSASASAAFIWVVRRFVRSQKVAIAHNTIIWMIFFFVIFALAILDCMATIARSYIPDLAGDIVWLVLLLLNLIVLAWCILRLKAIASDVPSTRENAGL
jgi:drug/metabolite transporter (DMT)-like permease